MKGAGFLPRISPSARVGFLGAILARKLVSGTPAIGEACVSTALKSLVVEPWNEISERNYFTAT